jgi:amino acid transporter
MARTHTEAFHAVEGTNRMGLKAPGLLTFLLSFVIMLAVMFAKYFGASIPGLSGDVTQFAGLLIAYLILVMGCIFRAL